MRSLDLRRSLLLLAVLGIQTCFGSELALHSYGLSFQYNSNSPFLELSETNDLVEVRNFRLSDYNNLTIEFWALWVGSSGGVFPWIYQSNRSAAFFYGTPFVGYLSINPSNGGYFDSGTDNEPYSSAYIGGNFHEEINTTGISGVNEWCHFALSVQPDNFGPSQLVVSCPDQNVTNVVTGSLQAYPSATGDKILFGSGNNTDGSYAFAGSMDEVRIWNHYRDNATVAQYRKTSLTGKEAGLLAYWKFDEGSGPVVYDSTGNNHTGYLSVSPNDPLWLNISYFTTRFSGRIHYYLIDAIRSIDYNGSTTITYAHYNQFVQQGTLANGTVLVNPVGATLCLGAATTIATCNAITNSAFTFAGTLFSVSLVPGRGVCGSTVTFQISVSGDIETSPTSTVTTAVGSVTAAVGTVTSLVSTSGGTVTINGVGFGLDGNLTSFESVSFVKGGVMLPCTSARVNQAQIICNVGSGVGANYDLVLSLCHQTQNYTKKFSYQAPTVTSVALLNTTDIRITGTNFGSSGATRTPSLNYVIFNQTINCIISSIDQNSITCQLSQRLNDSIYNTSLSVEGQIVHSSFNYTLCSVPCLNNGTCVGLNTCDCTRTGYKGAACETQLDCIPPCEYEKGVCEIDYNSLTTNSTNSTGVKCTCIPGYTGDDCGTPVIPPAVETPPQKSSANIPVIVGASVGAGVVIIILIIVVIILVARRKPQRGTSTFIPLEKKDFANIIYGEQLNESPEKHSGDLKRLEELLVQDNLELAFAVSQITQITEADKIAKAMVVVFEDNHKVIPLLEAFVNDEVRTTEHAGTLFRSNSMVSKMFKFYSRLIGLPYLYTTIGPEMDEIIADELGLEVDPEKMGEGTDLDEMRWTLMAQSQKILKSIIANVEDCPPQFRELFGHIKRCVEERFPEQVNTTIGGFIFLRFFCPAVSSPEAYGIVEEPPSASARRLLILITKVLQNLSNDVEFGSKEPYMTKLNDFIQSNRLKLAQFYDKLVKPSSKLPVMIDMPKNIKSVSLSILSLHIRENLSKIENPEMRQKLQSIVQD